MTFYKAWDTWLKVPKSVSLPYCQEKYSYEVPLRYVLCIEFYCDTLKKNHMPEPRLYYAAVSLAFHFYGFTEKQTNVPISGNRVSSSLMMAFPSSPPTKDECYL